MTVFLNNFKKEDNSIEVHCVSFIIILLLINLTCHKNEEHWISFLNPLSILTVHIQGSNLTFRYSTYVNEIIRRCYCTAIQLHLLQNIRIVTILVTFRQENIPLGGLRSKIAFLHRHNRVSPERWCNIRHTSRNIFNWMKFINKIIKKTTLSSLLNSK